MRPFVTLNQLKNLEETCFQNGFPVAAAMEKAGLNCARLFEKIYPQTQHILIGILVGPGHNGGDALVVARELFLKGYQTKVLLVTQANSTETQQEFQLKDLPKQHLQYYRYLGGQVVDQLKDLEDCEILIDGIFGFGISNKLTAQWISFIQAINALEKKVVSLDMPSGLDTDFGFSHGACIKASHTFCIGAYKMGLVEDHAVDFVGELHFIDIGLRGANSVAVSDVKALPSQGFASRLHQYLPEKRNINKYSNGVCFLFSGSTKYPGAGFLSAKGALASGAGYVQLVCAEALKFQTVSKIPDVIFLDFEKALEKISSANENNFAILCGSGQEDETILARIISHLDNKKSVYPCLVLDAAVLNEKNKVTIKNYQGAKIITPHHGEFCRMFPEFSSRMVKENRDPSSVSLLSKIDAAKMAAKEIRGVVLYKGPHSVVADESGKVYVDMQSTSALARAGCGDVLAGLISGLVAKGLPSFYAVCQSVYLQSKTARELEKQYGKAFVTASHLADSILY